MAAMQTLPPEVEALTWFTRTPTSELPRPQIANKTADALLTARRTTLSKRNLSDLNTYIFLLHRNQTAPYRLRATASQFLDHPAQWLKENFSTRKKSQRYLAGLERNTRALKNTCEAFIQRFDDRFSLTVLKSDKTFGVLSEHLIPNAAKRLQAPIATDFLDCQLASSHVEWHREFLAVDDKRVSVLSLRHPPPHTFVDMFREMRRIPGRWTVVTDWKRVPEERARIELQRRYLHLRSQAMRFSITSALKKRDLEFSETLRNLPVQTQIAELNECEREIVCNSRYLGDFSLKTVLWTSSEKEERELASQFMRLFTRMGGQLIEERLGSLAEYLDTVPGNYAYGTRRMLLLDANYADLVPIFSIDTGERRNAHLDADCLTIMETNEGCQFSMNLHVRDIGGTLLFGRPGSGKTFFLQHLIVSAQQYRPRLYVFDVAGSYEQLTRALGGAYFRLTLQEQEFSLGPFATEFNRDTWARLIGFTSMLIERNGFSMTAQQKNELGEAIKNLYELRPESRRLSTLASILPRALQPQLSPWIDDGPYARLFDNADDRFQLADFQCFDFSSLREQLELLEPLVYLLQTRIEDAVSDPAARHVPKFLFSDEAWWFMRHEALIALHRDCVKRWRRYNGSIILATQSSDDLTSSAILQAAIENCPTKIFLASPDIDEKVYGELFHLNATEVSLLRALQPKKQLLFKQSQRSKVLNFTSDPISAWLFTTNPYDAKRRDEAIAEHGIETALEILSGETTR